MAQTNRTEETAKQQAAGTDPVTQDSTAKAEEAVDLDSSPRARRAARTEDDGDERFAALEARVAALEEENRKLQMKLRHWH